MSRPRKAKEGATCPSCGRNSLFVEKGDIQPTCHNCGWTVDNVVRFPFAGEFPLIDQDFEERYTLVINEHDDITFVSLIAPSGKVVVQSSEESRHAALQKVFTKVVLHRNMS